MYMDGNKKQKHKKQPKDKNRSPFHGEKNDAVCSGTMPKACPYAMMHPHLLWLTKIIASGMKKALAGGGCEGRGRDYLMLF